MDHFRTKEQIQESGTCSCAEAPPSMAGRSLYVETINLRDPRGKTGWMPIPPQITSITVDVVNDDDSHTWGSAIVELKWSVATHVDDRDGESLENAVRFKLSDGTDAPVTFATATRSQPNVGVVGIPHVRLEVTTADQNADPQAKVLVLLQ